MPSFKVPVYGDLHVPQGITDLRAFRHWIHAAEVPEKLAVHFLRGEVWVDFHMEEAFSHNFVKTALYATLAPICDGLGLFFCDGMLLTNDEAGVGTEPDGMFASDRAFETGRIEFTAGPRGEDTELVGTPDLVIEVVSRSSEDKDTEWLMSAYHNAGIPEYWLIDARDQNETRFDIYKRRSKGYIASRKSEGWVKSATLGKSFRLTRRLLPNGYPRYKLAVR